MTPERWRRMEDVFHEARARSPELRDAYLREACAGDSVLRLDVEALLAQPDGSLVDGGAGGVLSALVEPSRMSLEGRSLGPYQLGALLGSGGMGDVYRARDTKLGRDVAVKILSVLPAGPADPSGRQARFEREARILAQLSHPHIAAIHGLEEADGIRALILELVEGVSLKERLAAGALPLEEAVAIARQIIDALDAAHQKGIIHRDLKPANIQITPQGDVKVLDFGLARMEDAGDGGPAAGTALETRDGVLLGTVAYMSPEQARGLAVDRRTDIWAFGCVLFQMVTGTRPFGGETAADVIAEVTRSEPDWSRLPGTTPAGVRRLLRRCLVKDRDRRLRDIADARLDLDEIVEGDVPGGPSRGAPSGAGSRSRLTSWIVIGVAAAVAAAWWWAAGPVSSPAPAGAMRVDIELPPGVSIALGRGSSVAVSPDGQRLVFAGVSNGHVRLYARALSASESVPIPGTDGAQSPFFSPDGRWIGFWSSNELKRTPIDGGPVFTIAASAYFGAAWGPDDAVYFTRAATTPLFRVPAAGGDAVATTSLSANELHHSWAQVVPGGRALLYTAWNNTGFDGGRILVRPLEGGEPSLLVEGASYGRVVRAGGGFVLVYARPEGLLAAPFNPETRQLTGPAVPVIDGVHTNLSGGAHFSVSETGVLAYVPGTLDELDKSLVWVDKAGMATPVRTIPGFSFNYTLSPDGRRVARPNAYGSDRDIWVDDLIDQTVPTRLTFGGIHNRPIWTPDGRRVIYASGVPASNLFWTAADGSGGTERLTTSDRTQIPGSVSPDGTTLAFEEGLGLEDPSDIWLLPLGGNARQARRFVSTPFRDGRPAFSPDGRWLAYTSNVSGRFEVYLTPFPEGGRHVPVSSAGGFLPMWSPDGRELYFRTSGGDSIDARMMAVSVDTRAREPVAGLPRQLFAIPLQGDGGVAPDGRFLFLEPTPRVSSSRVIRLVLNWLDDLAARVARR